MVSPLFLFKPKKLAATLAVSLPLLAPLSFADSLNDIYQLALNNDATFKVAEANRSANQLNTQVGRSGLLPQINGYARYVQNDLSTDPKVGANYDTDVKTTSYGATLTQPLFDANAWYTYQQSKAGVDASEAGFRSEQQGIILRVASAYFAALKAVDDLSTAVAEENALSSSLEQTKQRFEVGLTAITEVHEAQAEFDSARANRLIREGDLAIAFEALEVLTGQKHNQLAPLKALFPVTSPIPAERESWVDIAKTNNLELVRANHELEAAKADYQAKRSNHLPTLSAELNYNNADADKEIAKEDLSDVTDGTSATITLAVPLYSGGRISAQRQQAASRQVIASETVNQTQRRVIQDVRSLHQRVNTGVATIKARKQAIVSSESALEATRAGYDVGTRNLVNVLDAQRKVYAAKRDYLGALYDYVLYGLQLKQAAGTLTSGDVAQLDQWLNKEQLVGLNGVPASLPQGQ